MNTFPTATDARAGSRNNLAIHAEIRAIEDAIYTTIALGFLNVDVGTGTTVNGVTTGFVSPMTDPMSYNPNTPNAISALDYYGVLFASVDNRSLREQTDIVQQNFSDLGYQISPLKNTSTGNTFFWRILW